MDKELNMSASALAERVLNSYEKGHAMIIPADAMYRLSLALKAAEVQLAGADERAKQIFDAKNHWADRARAAEAQLAELAAQEPRKVFTCTGCQHSLFDEHPSRCDCAVPEAHYVESEVFTRAAPPFVVKLPKSERLDGNGYGYYFDMHEVFVALDEAGVKYKSGDGSVVNE